MKKVFSLKDVQLLCKDFECYLGNTYLSRKDFEKILKKHGVQER